MPIIYLLLAFTLNGVANIILKVSANRGLDLSVWNPATLVAKNYLFLLGLAIFAANVIFYFLALRSIPISVAYPVMVVMSFLLINAYAVWGLGEVITPGQVVGYFLLVLGLIMIFYFKI